MPPINPFLLLRTLPVRSQPATVSRIAIKRSAPAQRAFTDNAKSVNNNSVLPEAEGNKGPNTQQQEHVSEEAAKMAKATGGEGPDIEGQGTPVQDILQGDKEAQKQAPQIMKESMKTGQGANMAKPDTNPKRGFHTMARRRQEDLSQSGSPELEPSMIPSAEQRAVYNASSNVPAVGHKFGLPQLPIPATAKHDKRYDTVVDQVTNLIMEDGKLATAQRNMSYILNVLRTAPPPTYSAQRNLLPGAPPASHLPLNPVLYLTLAIDSVAPLLRLRSQRGAAGGGVALQIPVPLGLRQRRRQAMVWILDVVSKKKSRSSGRYTFAQRLAEELISVVEGKSAVWTRRDAVHKLGTTARSNLNYGKGGRR